MKDKSVGFEAQVIALSGQGLSAEDISQALTLDLDAVELVLRGAEERRSMECSKLEKGFSALEDLAISSISNVLAYSENDSAKVRAAGYVLDQRLGLKKPATTTHITIQQLNMRIEQARERAARFIKDASPIPV